jgi:hypothetical protein
MFRKIDPDPVFEPVFPSSFHCCFKDVEIAPLYMAEARRMKLEYDEDLTRLIRRLVSMSSVRCY